MQTPEPMVPPRGPAEPYERRAPRQPVSGLLGRAARLDRRPCPRDLGVHRLVRRQPNDGLTLSVTGWHTGALGKLVFFAGLATLILEALREAGIELPATVPESLVLIALGSLATIFVLIRIISVPDTFFGTAGRGIGIFISLIAAIALIVAGLLRAAEEL